MIMIKNTYELSYSSYFFHYLMHLMECLTCWLAEDGIRLKSVDYSICILYKEDIFIERDGLMIFGELRFTLRLFVWILLGLVGVIVAFHQSVNSDADIGSSVIFCFMLIAFPFAALAILLYTAFLVYTLGKFGVSVLQGVLWMFGKESDLSQRYERQWSGYMQDIESLMEEGLPIVLLIMLLAFLNGWYWINYFDVVNWNLIRLGYGNFEHRRNLWCFLLSFFFDWWYSVFT